MATAPSAQADVQLWEENGSLHVSNLEPPRTDSMVLHEPVPASEPAATAHAGEIALNRLVAQDATTAERLNRFGPLVSREARRYGLDQALVHALVATESAYNPGAVSRRGAIGLMQVMPATALRFGVRNLRDPVENLRAGCLYLKTLLQLFHENVALAVAAYNAGENAVVRHGNQIPPFPETQRYVPQVISLYQGLLR